MHMAYTCTVRLSYVCLSGVGRGGGGGGFQGLAPPLNSAHLHVHASGVKTTGAPEAGTLPLFSA